MKFKIGWVILLLCGFLICTSLSSCKKNQPEQIYHTEQSDKKWDRQRADLEYRWIKTELALAKSEELYLVVDFLREEIQLRLKGALLWNYPIHIVETDSQEVREFAQRFQGDLERLIRPLSAKHLFAAQDKMPDSVLEIVGEVVKVDPGLLQREVPSRFQLLWGSDLTLEVRTDVVGEPKSPLKNALVELRHNLRRLFGEAHVIVKMDPEGAITLYRAARPGLPTLLYPPL